MSQKNKIKSSNRTPGARSSLISKELMDCCDAEWDNWWAKQIRNTLRPASCSWGPISAVTSKPNCNNPLASMLDSSIGQQYLMCTWISVINWISMVVYDIGSSCCFNFCSFVCLFTFVFFFSIYRWIWRARFIIYFKCLDKTAVWNYNDTNS